MCQALLINKQNSLKVLPLGAIHTNASWYLFFPPELKLAMLQIGKTKWKEREKASELNEKFNKTLAGNFTPFCRTVCLVLSDHGG